MRREHINEVYREVTDIYGRHALRLRIDVPRSITAKGLAATRFALLSLLIVGVIVVLVLILTIRHMILGPVSRMTQHAVRIAEHDDLTVRLALDRRDELGILAREFDKMVDKLEDARRRLVDHSFEAGAAQLASGVLHNVGNAMTPLGVTVASLQKRLREAPGDDVALVLSELDKAGDSPERRADLEEFLRLTGRELASAVTQARGEADTVARQAEMIQQVLAQQLRSSHAAPVIEAVRLPDLIERAVEMVPTALRPFLALHVDPALQSLKSVHVARTTLQQVFQNLIQNAAESMRDAGRTRGNLHVSGGIVAGPDGGRLELRFSDDGAGIAPEHLPRIFERGFSTKSRDSNSGIGLHWCANALHALGGSLKAEQPASGRGASFLVTFPDGRARHRRGTRRMRMHMTATNRQVDPRPGGRRRPGHPERISPGPERLGAQQRSCCHRRSARPPVRLGRRQAPADGRVGGRELVRADRVQRCRGGGRRGPPGVRGGRADLGRISRHAHAPGARRCLGRGAHTRDRSR